MQLERVVHLGLGKLVKGDGPIIASAVHAGHEVRPEIAAIMALGEEDRRREEDPFTDRMIGFSLNRIELSRSRFEVDVNRPRDRAVYRDPSESWGLKVWREGLPDWAWEASLALYDEFYGEVRAWLEELVGRHGGFVILDIHSYNHRRTGPTGAPADPELNPEVDVGTACFNRHRWGRLIDRFLADLGAQPIRGRLPDVRENIKWPRTAFADWVKRNFPGRGILLPVEFKKIFMDEWTGTVDDAHVADIAAALAATVPGLHNSLAILKGECR